jgi:hypothetical protein
MKEILRSKKISIFLHHVPSASLLDDSAGGIARELWWTNQGVFSIDIIPPRLSILIYDLGEENTSFGGGSSEI